MFASLDELGKLSAERVVAEFAKDQLDGFGHRMPVAIEQVEGFFKGIDVGLVARTSQSDEVHRTDLAGVVHRAEWRDIAGRALAAGDHGESTNPHKLMDPGVPAEESSVLNGDMTAQQSAVGQCAVVADDAVVGGVGIGHEVVAIADGGRIIACGTVDGHALAEDIFVADSRAWTVFTRIERSILRGQADACVRVERIGSSDLQWTLQVDIGDQLGVFADGHLAFDDAVGSDRDARTQFDLRINDGGRMNR